MCNIFQESLCVDRKSEKSNNKKAYDSFISDNRTFISCKYGLESFSFSSDTLSIRIRSLSEVSVI